MLPQLHVPEPVQAEARVQALALLGRLERDRRHAVALRVGEHRSHHLGGKAAPARLRPLVAALGAAFVVAVCYSFLALAWHFPSDVLGGFLVATTWTLLAVAALLANRQRTPAPRAPATPRLWHELAPSAAAVLIAASIALLVAVARPHAVVAFARTHETFMLGAGAIAVIALALATGLMLAVRR